MKQLGLIFLGSVLILANEGKEIFDNKCLSCHAEYIPMSKLKENYLDHNNTLLNLKAPTLNQLSYRLKQRIGDPKGDEDMHRMEIAAFITDYVFDPDKGKSVCLEDVIKHFETMPSMKGHISEDELEEVSNYIYDSEKKVLKEKSVKYEDFEQALQTAKKEHKIVMIKATSKDCHYCRKMDREVLIEPEVIEAIKKDFIPVQIDVSTSNLPLGLKSDLTPTFIFIDRNSEVLMKIPGAWDKTDFLEILKEAKQKDKQ